MVGVADVGEETVIDGWESMFAFEGEEAVLAGLVAPEFERAEPGVDAEDGGVGELVFL